MKKIILFGSQGEKILFDYTEGDKAYRVNREFEGIIPNLSRRYRETDSSWVRDELERFQNNRPCQSCNGFRLKEEALAVRIAGIHIGEIVKFSTSEAAIWINSIQKELSPQQNIVAKPIIKEIAERLKFLNNVGLGYLTLSRSSGSLSGGESQRIRLASQIGSGLTGVLYVLDERSIGLHQRDNGKLLQTLKDLRNQGNSVIVVEHDEEAIREADFVIDMGPGAGSNGGMVVAQGSPAEISSCPESLTGQYLSGLRCIDIRQARRL